MPWRNAWYCLLWLYCSIKDIYEISGTHILFSSRCIFDIYCYNQSGVHPTVCFVHVWHTPAPVATPPTLGRISFSTNYKRVLDMDLKNAPEGLIKTVTDAGPIHYKMDREWGSVSQDSCTHPLKRTPSLEFFKGMVKTKLTEGNLGRVRLEARHSDWGSLAVHLYNLLPRHRMVLILWDSTSRSKTENNCWFN